MEPSDHNRRAWDEIHRRRTESIAGELGIPEEIRPLLPEVAGKHVLHLQCATGESTAELVALGALVTAVDISAEALAVARDHAPNASLVHADVHELPLQLRRGRFDLVYNGGVHWLQDLDPWAGGIVSALRPGGELLLYGDHPVLACLDDTLHWVENYFDDSLPASAAGNERFWRLGQVLSALGRAGLCVVALEELPSQRTTRWRPQDRRVPGLYAVRAGKPS